MNAKLPATTPAPHLLLRVCAQAGRGGHHSPAYIQAGGTPVEAVFEPTFRLLTRIEAGARPDVMVGITGSLADLVAAGIVEDPRPVARTGVGVAVPPDVPSRISAAWTPSSPL